VTLVLAYPAVPELVKGAKVPDPDRVPVIPDVPKVDLEILVVP
jgi:hypothetical protein